VRHVTLLIGLLIAGSSACAQASVNDCEDKLTGSLELIGKMKSDGLDLSKKRVLTQYFYGSKKQLRQLQPELTALGYLIKPSANKDGLLAEIEAATDEAWARSAIPQVCGLAEKVGVEYDGWDIDVAADNISAASGSPSNGGPK
jgi:hypothetical protein